VDLAEADEVTAGDAELSAARLGCRRSARRRKDLLALHEIDLPS
jgi:hypothetical protein